MKTTQLFPGAWVDPDKPKQVIGIDTHRERIFFENRNWVAASYFDPIPLTPEILTEWFGFGLLKGHGVSDSYVKGINPVTVDYMIDVYQFEDEPGTFLYRNGGHKIKFVHELQRLYHALTGEPLIRKK